MNFDTLDLSDKQKEAVIYAIYQIARSDNDLEDSEISFLSSLAEGFGKVFNHLSISNLIVKNSSEHLGILCSLNEIQKEFFIVAAYTMINKDHRLLDEEFSLTNQFFRVMNISSEKAIATISKINNKVDFY